MRFAVSNELPMNHANTVPKHVLAAIALFKLRLIVFIWHHRPSQRQLRFRTNSSNNLCASTVACSPSSCGYHSGQTPQLPHELRSLRAKRQRWLRVPGLQVDFRAGEGFGSGHLLSLFHQAIVSAMSKTNFAQPRMRKAKIHALWSVKKFIWCAPLAR